MFASREHVCSTRNTLSCTWIHAQYTYLRATFINCYTRGIIYRSNRQDRERSALSYNRATRYVSSQSEWICRAIRTWRARSINSRLDQIARHLIKNDDRSRVKNLSESFDGSNWLINHPTTRIDRAIVLRRIEEEKKRKKRGSNRDILEKINREFDESLYYNPRYQTSLINGRFNGSFETVVFDRFECTREWSSPLDRTWISPGRDATLLTNCGRRGK